MPGQDLLIQAMSGVMFNTGRAGDPPTACGTPVADFAASQALAIGILGALIARDRHGIGQRIETNLYSATLNLMGQENFAVLNQDITLKRSEAGVASCWNDAPYGAHPTADGWIAIAMMPLPGKVGYWMSAVRSITSRSLSPNAPPSLILTIFEPSTMSCVQSHGAM